MTTKTNVSNRETLRTNARRAAVGANLLGLAVSALAFSVISTSAANATVTTDPGGDIFDTYTGPKTSKNSLDALDITGVEALLGTDSVLLTLDVAGLVKPADSEGFYVWGVDRGKGSDRFSASNEGKGTLFDFTVIVRPDGTGTYSDLILGGGAKTLDSALITIKGGQIQVKVPLFLMPGQNAAPADYAYTLWTRATANGVPTQSPQLFADFAPRITAAVPEPASWALLIAGFGGVGGAMRRRRALLPAA